MAGIPNAMTKDSGTPRVQAGIELVFVGPEQRECESQNYLAVN